MKILSLGRRSTVHSGMPVSWNWNFKTWEEFGEKIPHIFRIDATVTVILSIESGVRNDDLTKFMASSRLLYYKYDSRKSNPIPSIMRFHQRTDILRGQD